MPVESINSKNFYSESAALFLDESFLDESTFIYLDFF